MSYCSECAALLRENTALLRRLARDEAKGDRPRGNVLRAKLYRLFDLGDAWYATCAAGADEDKLATIARQRDRIIDEIAPAPPVEPSAEERQRTYDHGPDGDATTPGFFGGATK